jgi:pimeloyl-ACP methyl ester carboxylesterase
LAHIRVSGVIVQSGHGKIVKPDRAGYLARSIADAALIVVPEVSHFALLQRPAQFNQAALDFLRRVLS